MLSFNKLGKSWNSRPSRPPPRRPWRSPPVPRNSPGCPPARPRQLRPRRPGHLLGRPVEERPGPAGDPALRRGSPREPDGLRAAGARPGRLGGRAPAGRGRCAGSGAGARPRAAHPGSVLRAAAVTQRQAARQPERRWRRERRRHGVGRAQRAPALHQHRRDALALERRGEPERGPDRRQCRSPAEHLGQGPECSVRADGGPDGGAGDARLPADLGEAVDAGSDRPWVDSTHGPIALAVSPSAFPT